MGDVNFTDRFLRTYRRGEVIFEEGSVGQHLFVVRDGGVDIRKKMREQEVLIGTLGAGEIFGEMALVDSLPRSATAIAAEDDTVLVAIDHGHFIYLIGQEPAFALVVLKALSLKLRAQMAAPRQRFEPPPGV